MRKFHPALLLTISDIMANLSAGWFGAAIIFPSFSDEPLNLHMWLLVLDILCGILFLVLAYRLRKAVGKGKI